MIKYYIAIFNLLYFENEKSYRNKTKCILKLKVNIYGTNKISKKQATDKS